MDIPLTQGKVTRIDDSDAALVSGHHWWATKSTATGQFYATTKVRTETGRWRVLHMQRFLMGDPPNIDVDHANGDTLDNQRSNLRGATRSQNKANNHGYRTNNTGFKGVYRRATRWVAQIRHQGRCYGLGSYSTAEDAARAYDAKARELFGPFAGLNFPD